MRVPVRVGEGRGARARAGGRGRCRRRREEGDGWVPPAGGGWRRSRRSASEGGGRDAIRRRAAALRKQKVSRGEPRARRPAPPRTDPPGRGERALRARGFAAGTLPPPGLARGSAGSLRRRGTRLRCTELGAGMLRARAQPPRPVGRCVPASPPRRAAPRPRAAGVCGAPAVLQAGRRARAGPGREPPIPSPRTEGARGAGICPEPGCPLHSLRGWLMIRAVHVHRPHLHSHSCTVKMSVQL